MLASSSVSILCAGWHWVSSALHGHFPRVARKVRQVLHTSLVRKAPRQHEQRIKDNKIETSRFIRATGQSHRCVQFDVVSCSGIECIFGPFHPPKCHRKSQNERSNALFAQTPLGRQKLFNRVGHVFLVESQFWKHRIPNHQMCDGGSKTKSSFRCHGVRVRHSHHFSVQKRHTCHEL